MNPNHNFETQPSLTGSTRDSKLIKELKELLFYITYKRISGIHYICEALKGDNGNVYLSVTRDKNYRENIIDNTRSVQG